MRRTIEINQLNEPVVVKQPSTDNYTKIRVYKEGNKYTAETLWLYKNEVEASETYNLHDSLSLLEKELNSSDFPFDIKINILTEQ